MIRLIKYCNGWAVQVGRVIWVYSRVTGFSRVRGLTQAAIDCLNREMKWHG